MNKQVFTNNVLSEALCWVNTKKMICKIMILDSWVSITSQTFIKKCLFTHFKKIKIILRQLLVTIDRKSKGPYMNLLQNHNLIHCSFCVLAGEIQSSIAVKEIEKL